MRHLIFDYLLWFEEKYQSRIILKTVLKMGLMLPYINVDYLTHIFRNYSFYLWHGLTLDGRGKIERAFLKIICHRRINLRFE